MMMGELNPSENTVRIITYVRNMFNLFSDIFVTECPKSSGLGRLPELEVWDTVERKTELSGQYR